MGHPDRQKLRQKKKEKMLARKSYFNVLDLTPHNAIGKIKHKAFEVKYK